MQATRGYIFRDTLKMRLGTREGDCSKPDVYRKNGHESNRIILIANITEA